MSDDLPTIEFGLLLASAIIGLACVIFAGNIALTLMINLIGG